MKKIVLGILLMSICFAKMGAQPGPEVELSADMVSSYVWRGFKQAGASVQPGLSVGYRGFSLGAWGSMDISSSGSKEVDFSLAYETGRVRFSLTDYWWDGEGALRYFSWPDKEKSAGHYLEAGLNYTLSPSFPLSASWNTFVLGKGNKKENGDNSFSTYIELAYPFSLQGVDMGVSAGFIPWESVVYDMDGFNFSSIQLSATKEIKITESFSLPVFGNVVFNPNREDVHFIFGISLP
jgi:Bacterial protein of unknown function (Gcw_chp).